MNDRSGRWALEHRIGALAVVLAAGCGGASEAPKSPVAKAASHASSPASTPASSADALGPRPVLGPAKDFVPPAPVEITTAKGLRLWLLERHGLPLVSMVVA